MYICSNDADCGYVQAIKLNRKKKQETYTYMHHISIRSSKSNPRTKS